MKILKAVFILGLFFLVKSNLIAQEGDVNVRIPESSVNESIQTLLDTKAFNFAAYDGPGWLGYRTLHINANSITTNLKAAPPGQENVELAFNVTARAEINLLFIINFNVELDGTFKIYGTTEVSNEEQGYKVNMRVLGIRDFSVTNTIIDAFLLDIFEDVVERFEILSFNPLVQILPSTISQYFTSPNPSVAVTNDEIILSLSVNELYLGNDTVRSALSYQYPYIDAGQNFLIENTGNLTLKSGTKGIKIRDGFKADYGSKFKASIDPALDIQDNFNLASMYSENPEKKLYTVLDTLSAENKGTPDNIPDKFELYQNYPNPFNPDTFIKFDLPKITKVKITVYDIIGKEVARIVDTELNAGAYQYVFNGSNLSSGIYFYRIETTEFISIKKMMLIK